MTKLFVTPFQTQAAEIKQYCLGECGKAEFGLLHDDQYNYSSCSQTECPYLDKEMSTPMGEVDGQALYLRKLVDLPKAS